MSYSKEIREDLLKSNKMTIMSTYEDLANELLISESMIRKINSHSNRYYKTFYIKKNGNNTNLREIVAPQYILKTIQAWVLRNILEKRELHKCAMAYRKGNEFGIKRNAIVHKNKEYIMKIDFKDFFSSITRNRVFFMFNDFGYPQDMSNLLANICTYNNKLPQGAVTSPYISNILLYDFDEKMHSYCLENSINYTRYSDDIVLSCDRKTPLEGAKQYIIELIRDFRFLKINDDKSFKIYDKNTSQIVTGLLINNNDVRVSRTYKRRVRAQIYNEVKVKKNIPSNEIYGKLGYIKEMDPVTFDQMIQYIKKLGIEDRFRFEFCQTNN